MGVELAPDEVAYRCNLVTVDDDGATMVDFAAGHLTSEQSHPIVAALDAALGDGRDGVRFHPGVEYRHLCVVPTRPRRRRVRAAARPHRPADRAPDRAGGGQAHRADGRVEAGRARRRPPRSVRSRRRSGSGARARARSCPTFARALRRRRPAVVGGRPRARPRRAHRHRGGRRARRDRGLRQRLRRAARRRARVARRPRPLPPPRRGDRRGRPPGRGRREGRRRSSGGTPRSSARSSTRSATSRYRILLLPDHATPCAARTHTSDPVPYLLFDSDARRRRAASTPSAAWPGCTRSLAPRPDGAPARADPRAVVAAAVGLGGTVTRAAGRFFAQTLVDDPGFRWCRSPGGTPDLPRSDNSCPYHRRRERNRVSRCAPSRAEERANEPGAADRAVGARRQGPRRAPHHRRRDRA